jgi:cell division protein FtsB
MNAKSSYQPQRLIPWKACLVCLLTVIGAQAQQGGFSGPGGLPPGVTPELPKALADDKAAQEFMKNFHKAKPMLEKEGIIVDKSELVRTMEELKRRRDQMEQRPEWAEPINKFGFKKSDGTTQVPGDGPGKDAIIETLKTRIAALEGEVAALKDKNAAQAEVINLLKKRIAELEAGK